MSGSEQRVFVCLPLKLCSQGWAICIFARKILGVLLAGSLVLASFGATAQEFTFTDMQGNEHRLSGYRGKWVVVNFWATWCPPCLAEIPDLNALHEQYGKTKLAVIGIAMEYRDPKAVMQFADSLMMSYPLVLGDDRIAAQIGPVEGLPATYLYNPQGKLVAYNVGALTKTAVEAYIGKVR
jgi:thiol-disulfide isomerase/thioredoxin